MKKGILLGFILALVAPPAAFAAGARGSSSYVDGNVDAGAMFNGHGVGEFSGGFGINSETTTQGMTQVNAGGQTNGQASGTHGFGSVDGMVNGGGFADAYRSGSDSGTYNASSTDATASGHNASASSSAGGSASAASMWAGVHFHP